MSWPLGSPPARVADLGGEQPPLRIEHAAERIAGRLEVGGGELADPRPVGLEDAPSGRDGRLAGILAGDEASVAVRHQADHAVDVEAARRGGALDQHVLAQRRGLDAVDVIAPQAVALRRIEQVSGGGRGDQKNCESDSKSTHRPHCSSRGHRNTKRFGADVRRCTVGARHAVPLRSDDGEIPCPAAARLHADQPGIQAPWKPYGTRRGMRISRDRTRLRCRARRGWRGRSRRGRDRRRASAASPRPRRCRRGRRSASPQCRLGPGSQRRHVAASVVEVGDAARDRWCPDASRSSTNQPWRCGRPMKRRSCIGNSYCAESSITSSRNDSAAPAVSTRQRCSAGGKVPKRSPSIMRS